MCENPLDVSFIEDMVDRVGAAVPLRLDHEGCPFTGVAADIEAHATKLEAMAQTLVERHRAADALPLEPTLAFKAAKQITRLDRDAKQKRVWLAAHPEERRGPKGTVRQSNRTDNESAKMATGNGVIQGYTGVAAVDKAHQIIVEAQAHGTGSEQEVLVAMVTAMAPVLTDDSLITADAGYHSEANLKALEALQVDALIADGEMRRRDDRFATQDRHRETPDPLHDKSKPARALPIYQPSDFTYDAEARTGVCPAGKALYRKGQPVKKGLLADQYQGAKRDCVPCARRAQCLRTPETTTVRQVAFFHGREPAAPLTLTARMKERIVTPEGRAHYAERFGAVEPVFGNLRYNKGLDRFTLRGRVKVDGQWKLFCLVQHIEKLAKYGYAARARDSPPADRHLRARTGLHTPHHLRTASRQTSTRLIGNTHPHNQTDSSKLAYSTTSTPKFSCKGTQQCGGGAAAINSALDGSNATFGCKRRDPNVHKSGARSPVIWFALGVRDGEHAQGIVRRDPVDQREREPRE